MASGAEIFLIIFILLLVITGICLAIYFVWRHDQKKRTGPTGGTGGGTNGGGGTTGMTGTTGATGTSGDNFPKNQNFSIIANNPAYITSVSDEISFRDSVFLYEQNDFIGSACQSYYFQYKDVTRNNQTISNAIEFQYNPPGIGILYPSDSTISNYTVGSTTQTVNEMVIDNPGNIGESIPQNKINQASWIFKSGKICLQNSPNKCLYVSPSSINLPPAQQVRTTNLVLADDTNDTGDKGFIWDTSTVASPQNSTCRA